MKTILHLKKLVIISLMFLVGNVWGQQTAVQMSFPTYNDYNQNYYGHFTYPALRPNNTHFGKDVKGVLGDPIVSLSNGIVHDKFSNGTYSGMGNGLIMKYPGIGSQGQDLYALYLHLQNYPSLSIGDSVNQGQLIANIGASGVQSGLVHCHFELRYFSSIFSPFQQGGTNCNAQNIYQCGTLNNNPSWNVQWENPTTFIIINTESLNQNLTIYGGSVINPKPFYLYFKEADLGNYNFATSMVSNIKIEGMGNNVVPNSRIIDNEYKNVDGVGWRRLKIQLQIADLALINNAHDGRTISFDLTVGGVTKKYQNDQLYFADYQNTSSTFTDINDLNNWVETYVRKGAGLGLFKGTSLQTFNPSGTLQKQHAAKIIVEAGVRLGMLNINTSTTVGTFDDVNSSSEFFKHIQTLRNYGYITTGTNFNPTNAITIGQLCKLLVNVFEISDTDIAPTNFINLSQRKIVPISTDATLIPYMTKILRLVDIRENTPGFFFTENLWDFLDFSSVNAVLTGQIQVNGSNTISRGIMAKLITNIMIWKANKMNLTMFRSSNSTMNTQSLDDYISLGEKYDNASITATSTPITPTQQTYSCASGGSITILYNPGSLPQHYYWSMLKNGATLTSNNSAHSSVTFTAPTVSVPTQWKLYTYTANNKGKARETFITINVGGSSGGNDAHPTVQATNLQVTINNNQTNYIGLSWTRGNGQNCMVTATPLPNSESLPVDGQTYTHNQNFQLAPSIGNTKIVYQGTANSANIIGRFN